MPNGLPDSRLTSFVTNRAAAFSTSLPNSLQEAEMIHGVVTTRNDSVTKEEWTDDTNTNIVLDPGTDLDPGTEAETSIDPRIDSRSLVNNPRMLLLAPDALTVSAMATQLATVRPLAVVTVTSPGIHLTTAENVSAT